MISFAGRHYPPYIILQCVRWYVPYALSYRNIEEMVEERGFEIDHATLNRWVLHFAPLLEKRSRKYKRPVHGSWRMDETYIKIKGKWRYLYRCVDKYGKTVGFMLTKRPDTAARTIADIELMNMIKKKQLNFTKYIDQSLTPAQQFYSLASA